MIDNVWLIAAYSALSIYVGAVGALITWGLIKPKLDRKKYIVYTVDLSNKRDDESMDEFMARVQNDNLGNYEVID